MVSSRGTTEASNDCPRSTAIPAELSAVGIRLNRELLNCVRVGERQRRVEVRILIFRAIQRIHVRSADAAIDGVAWRTGALVQRASADRARHQNLQLQNVATIERQLGYSHSVDCLAERR